MTIFGKILQPFFSVSDEEATSFSESDRLAAQRLEMVIRLVTKGCQLTFQNSRFEALVPRLDAVEVELRGFAYEGAGIGLAALDCLLPWKNRIQAFLDGPGAKYIYAVPLGAGMGLARLHRNPERFLSRLDPVLGWLIIDGYGFHEGFFSRRRYVEKQKVLEHLSQPAHRVFDQGLGRAIWFLRSTNVEYVAATIATFQASRQADLWGGVGLACGYTGGADRAAVETLRTAAGVYRPQLATGAAIAANARHLVGNPSSYVKLACEVLCGFSTEAASQIVDAARENLPTDSHNGPAYLIWRQRVEKQFSEILTSEKDKENHLV